MSRVTSLTSMPEAQLNRWIKRIGLLLIIGIVAFTAFYVIDRYNPLPQKTMLETQIAAAEQKVSEAPADIAARGTLADLYVDAKRYQDAIAQYDAILATGKDEELARVGRARANQALGNTDEAVKDWQRVVEIAKDGEMAAVDPTLAGAYYQLGTIAQTKGDHATAVDNLKLSLAITKSDSDTLFALGTSYTALGRLDEAIDALKSAIAFVPIGWPEPYLGLQDAYTKKGDAAMATWAGAMAALAQGDAAAAETQLTPLIGGPADIDAAIGLGLAAEVRGDGATAVKWYQHVIDKDPSNAVARLGLARVRPVGADASASQAPGASQGGQN
jgi:tetratricopeptide (TPR) repeat protein